MKVTGLRQEAHEIFSKSKTLNRNPEILSESSLRVKIWLSPNIVLLATDSQPEFLSGHPFMHGVTPRLESLAGIIIHH